MSLFFQPSLTTAANEGGPRRKSLPRRSSSTITTIPHIPPPTTSSKKTITRGMSAIDKLKSMPWIVGSRIQIGEESNAHYDIGIYTRIFLTLEDADSSRTAKIIAVFVILLIILSTLSFVFSTLQQLSFQPSTCPIPVCRPTDAQAVCQKDVCEPQPNGVFDTIEVICISLFTIEYLLRLLTVHAVPMAFLIYKGYLEIGKNKTKATTTKDNIEPSGLSKTWCYSRQGMNLIDLAAILPYYIGLWVINSSGFGFLRILRLARLMRVFKLGKYSEGSTLFLNTMRKSASALSLLLFFMTIMIVVFGSLIYFVEQGTFKVTAAFPEGAYYRPTINGMDEELSPFKSIPLSFYWVIITTCTVGYGDLSPTSAWGRLIASLVAYSGILAIALPISIVGTNFSAEYEALYGPPGSSRWQKQEEGEEEAAEEERRGKRREDADAVATATAGPLKTVESTTFVNPILSSTSSNQEGGDRGKKETKRRRKERQADDDAADDEDDRECQGLLRAMDELQRLEQAVTLIRQQLHQATEKKKEDE